MSNPLIPKQAELVKSGGPLVPSAPGVLLPKASDIKFPVRKATTPSLVLPRRRGMPQPLASQPLQDASAEARRSINAIVSATRAPFGGPATLSPDQIEELERALRQVEHQLAERTRFAEEMEVKYAERMRELAELETLLAAREKVIDAAKQRAAGRPESGAALSAEERAALDALKVELDRQESSLKEQREALAEREQFLEENEGKLFEKMQQQQERETEIEQKLEELQERESRLAGLEAGGKPMAKPAAAPKVFDEFNE